MYNIKWSYNMFLSKFLDPKNDVAFRKIFGSEKHKDILIHFINDIMGFDGKDKVQDVTFLSPIQNPQIAAQKESIVDVLCKTQNGEHVIVEMQVRPARGFAKRAQYYAAKAYCNQLNKGKEANGLYENLNAVIFIAISDYDIFLDDGSKFTNGDAGNYISHHIILNKDTKEHQLKDFSFSFIELSKFKIEDIAKLKTLREKWCYFFKHAKATTEEDWQKLIGSDIIMKHAYEALYSFNWSESELLAYEAEMKRVLDNLAADEYAAELATEKGIAQGMEKGIAQGMEKGIAQGMEKGIAQGMEKGIAQGMEKGIVQGMEKGIAQGEKEAKISIAKNLLKNGLSMELVVSSTGLSEEEIKKLL